MEVQVREKCGRCNGTGIMPWVFGPVVCFCDGGYDYKWVDISELATKMDRAKPAWQDEQASKHYWSS